MPNAWVWTLNSWFNNIVSEAKPICTIVYIYVCTQFLKLVDLLYLFFLLVRILNYFSTTSKSSIHSIDENFPKIILFANKIINIYTCTLYTGPSGK